MRISLGSPIVRQSSEDIKKQIKRLLLASGVGDKLPTPKDDIVAFAKLVKVGQLDLSEYEEGWLRKGINLVKIAFSKIKGLIDFQEKVIYVSPEIHPAQQSFVTFHEVTHRVLPWHEGLYNPHLDDDYSIDPRLASGLEQEANIGASLILFQIDRFAKDLKELPLGLGSAKHLADLYGTSLHSTFRKYVEDNHRPCALLILEEIINGIPDNQRILRLWYPLQSPKFTEEFGLIDWEKFYYKGHPVYETVLTNSFELIKSGETTFRDLRGFDRRCRIEAFDNTFNHFVLVYPAQPLSSKTKIIVAHN